MRWSHILVGKGPVEAEPTTIAYQVVFTDGVKKIERNYQLRDPAQLPLRIAADQALFEQADAALAGDGYVVGEPVALPEKTPDTSIPFALALSAYLAARVAVELGLGTVDDVAAASKTAIEAYRPEFAGMLARPDLLLLLR